MKFILHWLDGKDEIVEGDNITQALTHAGYGAGAIHALDWYEPIKEEDSCSKKKKLKKS